MRGASGARLIRVYDPLRAAALAGLLAAALSGCRGPDPYLVAVGRGDVALQMGDASDAADAYRTALDARPGAREAQHGLGRAYLAQGDGENALVYLFNLSQTDPLYFQRAARADYRWALQVAARNRLERGDSAQALRYLRRLQADDPGNAGLAALLVPTLIAEGARLRVSGREDDADDLLREAVGQKPGVDATLALAQALVDGGQLDTAISLLSDALRIHHGDARLRALLDRALEMRYPDPTPIP